MGFNSKQFGWSNISVTIDGRIIEGITAIEYKESREKEFLYGRGSNPHEIISGNRSYEGKLTLWQSELEAMTALAIDNDVLNLEFFLTVSYVPNEGDTMVVDILQKVQFTEVPKGMAQGDKNKVVEMPIMFTKVKRQQ